VIQRKNISLDFGSWKLAWDFLKSCFGWIDRYDQLILANDSVYGPFFPLVSIFFKMQSLNLDFWSLTSSFEKTYHLQSYFLVFEKAAFKSHALEEFWRKFIFYRSKPRVIREYELGLSHFAKKQRWKMGAWIEFDPDRHEGVNSTLFSWDLLIEKEKFPFLKTEVLKLNRSKSERIQEWNTIISKSSNYPAHLIQNHLKRILN
jgi:lipopolysaccharide biosynthesis protein